METEVDSSIPCTVEWLKNDEILGPNSLQITEQRLTILERKGGIYQVSIKNAKEDDAGVYTCIIKNKVGNTKTTACLNVYTLPLFLQKLDKIDAVENCEAELCVEVSGNPKPVVTWLKNSEPLDLKNEIKYEEKINNNFYSLFIKSIVTNDAGTYQCSISNAAGKASSMGKLTIYPLTAPKFIKSLDETKLFPENEIIQLSVQVSGIPVPKLYWYKNGEIMNDEIEKYELKKDLSKGIYKLIGKSCGKAYSGNYEVKVSNQGGEVTSMCKVKVEGFKPTFLDKPEKIVCLEGETAILGCMVVGIPEPIVKWNLKGKEIILDSKKFKSYYDKELKAHFLEISSCGNNDKATYQIIASNEHGTEMAAVTLTISDKPEDVTDYKSGLRNTCISGRGKNEADHDWGKLKKAGARENTPDPDQNKLKLKHFESSKEAEIKKTVINNKTSEEINIELYPHFPAELIEYKKVEAIIVNKLEDEAVNKRLGETIISQQKKIETKEKNEEEIEENKLPESVAKKSNEKDSNKESLIEVPKIETCESAQIEKIKTDDITDVRAKIIRKLPEILNCKLNEKIILEVIIAKVKPKPTITWYLDDKEIKQNKDYTLAKVNDEEIKLIINKIDKKLCGRYTLKANNYLGEDISDCMVNLMQKPEILETLKDIIVNENESAEFQLKWLSCPIASTIWFEDNIELNASTENHEIISDQEKGFSKLKIKNCKIVQNNVKTYFVKLTNELGEIVSTKSTLTINSNLFILRKMYYFNLF